MPRVRDPGPRFRPAWLRVAAVAIVGLPAVAPAGTIDFRVEHDGELPVIRASATLVADAVTAWEVLTDYERYPAFIPGVRASRVVSRKANHVVVEQTRDASLGAVRAPVDITYRIDEQAPTRLVSQASAGGVPALESVYALTPTGDGVRLDYTGRVGKIAAWSDAGGQGAERAFRALADEIERFGAERARHPPRAPRER